MGNFNKKNTHQTIDASDGWEPDMFNSIFYFGSEGKKNPESERERTRRIGKMEYNWRQQQKWETACVCRRVYLRWALYSINRQNWEINIFYYIFVICVVVLILRFFLPPSSSMVSFNFAKSVLIPPFNLYNCYKKYHFPMRFNKIPRGLSHRMFLLGRF